MVGMIKTITTDKAPKAVGPYSQAIVANGFAFLSGQIAIDSQSNQFVGGSIEEQTRLTFANITAVLHSMGSNLNRVVKTTVFLKDMADFEAMNKVYSQFFQEHKPARSTIQVARLPKDAAIEIEMIALV
jgi:2-iminobutanoate/2-iminopropanoate deaminase